jgi:hypothetical protein
MAGLQSSKLAEFLLLLVTQVFLSKYENCVRTIKYKDRLVFALHPHASPTDAPVALVPRYLEALLT